MTRKQASAGTLPAPSVETAAAPDEPFLYLHAPAGVPRWEYIYETVQHHMTGAKATYVQQRLNQLGAQGWELVAVSEEERGVKKGMVFDSMSTGTIRLFFKRPLSGTSI